VTTPITRRTALKNIASTTALAATATGAALSSPHVTAAHHHAGTRQFKHSVCKWCFKDISLEDLADQAKDLGLESIELLDVDELPIINQRGLQCAMVKGVPGRIADGLNDAKNHDTIVAFMEQQIPRAVDLGATNLICFSGNRRGQSDEDGIEICAQGLARIVPIAEKYGATVTMELLNSKVNHPDYQCDHTEWGVRLCEKVGSAHFKLLYDIYHMQIMEGDLIRTIRDHHQWFSHYHTGGNPGRHELDGDRQEIDYPAVMRAITDTGYTGFVGQEFIPAEADAIASLRRAINLCSV
jgi:hydroxypyruvate isomerase